ncbi:ATP-binding protein [Chitinophaga sp.]|uniref:sensor histidine kinase n=1 Tax=Chitinophaga sp. TaxID=1869181 RepID=UPI0031CE7BDC
MRMRLRPILLLLLLHVTVLAHEIDTDAFHVRHFTDENGLPQNSVRFIAPDNAGFLWLATENGLVRFDGNRFSRFNSSRIRYIYPGNGRNNLYACTQEHEVIRMHNGQATALPDSPQLRFNDYEYYVLNDTVARTVPVTGLPNVYAEVVLTEKYMMPAGPQAYFSLTRDSVTFLQNGRPQYSFSWPNCDPWGFFTIGGNLYHLGEDGKIFLFQGAVPQEVKLSGEVPAERLQPRQLFWNYAAEQLFIYQDDRCYYLTAGAGGMLQAKLIMSGLDCEKNNIISLYYDAACERLFLGSRSRGLFVVTKKQFRPLVSPGDEDNVFYAQAPFGNNGILTAQGIVFEGNGETGRIPLLQYLKKANRYNLVQDAAGNYWYRHADTVYKYNADVTKLLWQRSFGNNISQLYAGPDNRLWIGTEQEGLYYLDTGAASPVPLLFSNKIKNAVYMMQEAPGILWACAGNGLYRVQLSPLRIDTIPGFGDSYFRSLFIPRPGEVWVTTYDKGFFLYRHGRWTAMPADRLEYLKTAHCITADNRGYYWITTNKGLFQAARKDLLAYADGTQPDVYYFYYSKAEGMLTNEFNGGCQPCALQLQNGDLSLPSLDGLLRFAPDSIRPDLPEGGLFLSEVELDAKPLAAADTLFLPSNFLRLALHVSTPYFGDAYNLQLRYSIEGSDDDAWLPVENSGIIAFSRLHSGTYRVRVRKVNGFGPDNYTEKIVTLIVETAWFATLPFRMLMFCLALLLLYVYIRLRTANIRRKNRQLRQHVSERTQELEETLASLRDSERQLRKQGVIQQRLITAITHDIKAPMKYLMLLSQAGSKPDKKSEAINDALYRMYNMIENLIQYMKMEAVQAHSLKERVDLHELLEEKVGIFKPIAEIRAVQIHNNACRGIKVPVNRQLLAIVVNNLLDNAVKYTLQGSVSLAASYEDGGGVSIRVTDTGIGMQPEIREWINGNPVATADHRQPLAQKGIGLVIVIELLQQINGKLVVHSNGDVGTSMEILLPAN